MSSQANNMKRFTSIGTVEEIYPSRNHTLHEGDDPSPFHATRYNPEY